MDFRLELDPKPFSEKIEHRHQLMLMGSCFTEQMGSRLAAYKFSTLENPYGILFNPISITRAITACLEEKIYEQGDLFFANERWNSWDHHSRFSKLSPEETLLAINDSRSQATKFIRQADWLILTLGSAFIYEFEDGRPVANCHKMPSQNFRKRLMTVEEILSALDEMIHRVFLKNNKLKIIFTISPVRHLRDGLVENNRSKAALIQVTHHLVEKFDRLFYFPAYELVVDDLRDYRFYAEDMVHPNYLATDYVWEKFQAACISPALPSLFKELDKINLARKHKPFHSRTGLHQKFLQQTIDKINALSVEFPYLNFSEELEGFRSQLINAS